MRNAATSASAAVRRIHTRTHTGTSTLTQSQSREEERSLLMAQTNCFAYLTDTAPYKRYYTQKHAHTHTTRAHTLSHILTHAKQNFLGRIFHYIFIWFSFCSKQHFPALYRFHSLRFFCLFPSSFSQLFCSPLIAIFNYHNAHILARFCSADLGVFFGAEKLSICSENFCQHLPEFSFARHFSLIFSSQFSKFFFLSFFFLLPFLCCCYSWTECVVVVVAACVVAVVVAAIVNAALCVAGRLHPYLVDTCAHDARQTKTEAGKFSCGPQQHQQQHPEAAQRRHRQRQRQRRRALVKRISCAVTELRAGYTAQ